MKPKAVTEQVIPIPYMEKSSKTDRVCLSCGLNVSDQYGYVAYKHGRFCPECGMPTVILWNEDAPPRCSECGRNIIDAGSHDRSCSKYESDFD